MTEEIVRPPTSNLDGGQKLSAGVFRNVVDAFVGAQFFHGDDERKAAERQLEEVRALIEHHTTDAGWRELLHRAHEAAWRGEHESPLLRFPSTQCTDGGRAINVGDPHWPATLTGAAADMYRIWHDELQPKGFHLTARILEYPGGNLGDAGLILSWAHDAQP